METIYYPLCNLQTYVGNPLEFFVGHCYPIDFSKDNRCTSCLPTGCEFTVRAIAFVVDGKGASSKVLDHMIKYGSFMFRICDKNYLIAPCRIMTREQRALGLEILLPVTIPENMTYSVRLEFSKKMKYTANIMCVLSGDMVRKRV